MLHSSAAHSSTPATPTQQQHHKASTSLPSSETDSFAMATLSPTSTASTDSSSSSHSSPLHTAASSGSSSASFSSLNSTPSVFASPSSSYPSIAPTSASTPSSMSAALLQQQQQQAQQKQQAIASTLLNSMQSHPPASFAHAISSMSTSPAIHSQSATSSSSPSPSSSYTASTSVPTSIPSTTSRRRGARRVRSPGHNRVPLWDTVRGKKLSGFASPMEKNLKRYLEEHPNCVLYDRAIHRVGSRGNDACKEGEDEEEEEEGEEEVPAELERIISSSPQSSSPLSHSPTRHPVRVGKQLPALSRGQVGRQQNGDAIPRSMPMPMLSSSLPAHVNIPPPLSSSLPNTSYSPAHSPQHSPSSKIAIKFEQLTMHGSASSNSLSSLASTSSSASSVGKVKREKGAKKLTQSPRNKPILIASNGGVAPMESSARSSVISRRMGEDESYYADGQPILAAAAVHPPYHQTLSVSVPLPSYVPQSMSSRPLTVDTYFEGHSPSHSHSHSHSHYPHPHQRSYPQLHSSSLSRSTTCSPTNSASHADPFSASSLNLSPRRKAKYSRAHPYHGNGDRTPKYADSRGRLDEDIEYKDSARWSHSLPSNGPHPAIYAPPHMEVAVDESGQVCTCGGAQQQQYGGDGYYVQHVHGETYEGGPPAGYHMHGTDPYHAAPPVGMTDEYSLHNEYQPHFHSHPHSHTHSHPYAHYGHHHHSHSHSHPHSHHHHSPAPPTSSMADNPPLRILSPVNGLSSAHSVSSESTHSSSSSNPSSKHLVYSRPISPSPSHPAYSHTRTSPPPLSAAAQTMYAVEVETKADGQTVVHHHHHYQVPAPAVSPSAWLVEGGVDDRVMSDEGQWTSYPSHPPHTALSPQSPPPQHAQYMAVTVSPTPHSHHSHPSRLDDDLYLAPSEQSGGAVQEYDLAAFDFTQLH